MKDILVPMVCWLLTQNYFCISNTVVQTTALKSLNALWIGWCATLCTLQSVGLLAKLCAVPKGSVLRLDPREGWKTRPHGKGYLANYTLWKVDMHHFFFPHNILKILWEKHFLVKKKKGFRFSNRVEKIFQEACLNQEDSLGWVPQWRITWSCCCYSL